MPTTPTSPCKPVLPVKGYIGPKGLQDNGSSLSGRSSGGGRHQPDHRSDRACRRPGRRADLPLTHHRGCREPRRRSPPDGAGPLVSARHRAQISWGHRFHRRRARRGRVAWLTMGSYGVAGVPAGGRSSRSEQHHDQLGLRWPASVAPFDVHPRRANKDDEATNCANRIWLRALDGSWSGCVGSTTAPRRQGEVRWMLNCLGAPWIVVWAGLANGRGRAAESVQWRQPRDRRTRPPRRSRPPSGADPRGFGCPCRRGRTVNGQTFRMLPARAVKAPAERERERERERGLRQRRHREGARTASPPSEPRAPVRGRHATRPRRRFSIRTARFAARRSDR